MAHVQEAIEHIFPLLYEFRKEGVPRRHRVEEMVPAEAASGDEEVEFDSPDEFEADSDDNVTSEGRLKEESFWSDEEEWNANKANGRKAAAAAAVAKKRPSDEQSASSKPKKVRRFAKSKPFRRRRPLGKALNDPSEDVMVVSDVEEDPEYF